MGDVPLRVLAVAWAGAILLPIGLLYLLVWMGTQTIYITRTGIGYSQIWHKPVEYPRSELAAIHLVARERRVRNLDRLVYYVSFVSAAHHELFSVVSYWGRKDLRKLAEACGVPLEDEWGGRRTEVDASAHARRPSTPRKRPVPRHHRR